MPSLETAAWCDLSGSEEIYRLTGEEREDFLSNYSTQDIKSLGPGKAALNAFLTQKGKLVTDAVVLNTDGAFLLFWARGYGEKVLEHLKVYLDFSEVEFGEATQDYFHVVLVGKESASRFTAGKLGSMGWHFSTDRFGLPSVELVGPREKQEAVVQELNSLEIPKTDHEAMEYYRIKGGIPKMGVDMDQNHLVAEVGLDRRATSFNKGCYLGQETTARVDTRGHVNRKLERFHLKQMPSSLPVPIHQGEKAVGTLTSACPSPNGEQILGLGIIQTKALESKEALTCPEGGPALGLTLLNHDGS